MAIISATVPLKLFIRLPCGVAKVRKEGSFRERKVPFAKRRFWLRKEDFFYFAMPV